jgi:protein TonB
VFAASGQHRFAPWLVASAFVHALGAVVLVAARPLPAEPLAPLRVVRVDLVAAPSPAPAPPRAMPKPVAKPAPAPAEAVAPVPPAPSPSAADAAPAGAEAGVGALAAVGAGPPGGTGSEAGSGSGGGDALAAYIAGLQRAIDTHKSYPPMARRRGIEGVVTVRLAIDALGGLEATALVGRPPEILARSTREAVARAGPFPPPPGGRLQVEFPVRYEIVD